MHEGMHSPVFSLAGYWKNFDVDFDAPGATSQDIDVYGVGLRVKF